jgi:hypothetical protein
VKNRNHSKALKEWLAAEERLVAAERKISATFMDSMFGPDSEAARPAPRPCVNVTPPKQPPKK